MISEARDKLKLHFSPFFLKYSRETKIDTITSVFQAIDYFKN